MIGCAEVQPSFPCVSDPEWLPNQPYYSLPTVPQQSTVHAMGRFAMTTEQQTLSAVTGIHRPEAAI